MLYYNFAGLNVKISGMKHADYFLDRLLEYQKEYFENADITVYHSEPSFIKKPDGEVIMKKGLRSWIATPDGGCGIYDSLPDSDGIMACVVTDKGWTNITTQLLDTVAIGGSPNSLRSFNMMGEIMRHALLKIGRASCRERV